MRALGIAKEVEVELRPEPIAYVAGDVFILCSDGLSDLVNPSEILDIAGSRPAAQAAGQLVDLANARGGHDNITAMIVRMKGSAAAVRGRDHREDDAADGARARRHDASDRAGRRATRDGAHRAAPRRSSPNLPPCAAPVGRGRRCRRRCSRLRSRPRRRPTSPSPSRHAPPPPAVGARRAIEGALVAGVVLGIIALAIAGTFVWTQQRPHHAPVQVVPFDALDGRRRREEDASTVAPDITLAPVLAPPSGVKVPWWKDPDAATPTGEPRECAIARWQKDAGRPPASWEPLEAKCRAAGGKL